MKHNKKVSLVGLGTFPIAIIMGLIFDLILERDLLEGLKFSILFGLVFSIGWIGTFTIKLSKKEKENILKVGLNRKNSSFTKED